VKRRAKRAKRAGPGQLERERSRREPDPDAPDPDAPDPDVLAHDVLAREHLALGERQRPAGVIRWLTEGSRSAGTPFSVFEEIFAPTRHEANLLLEAQRLVGAPAPAPSDPPFLEPVGAEVNSDRYRGRGRMRAKRIMANLRVADIEAAKGFYTDYLGLSTEEFNLGWVARYTSPDTGAKVQLVTRDASAPEDSVISIHTEDVEGAYEEAQKRGYEIVHPLTTEPWGVRRFFVRAPDGTVINIAYHPD
jgi:predicted enzyme related to lactoylglutathione lyase